MPKEIEASVQMRLYNLSKRHFAIIILSFFASFVISVFIGVAGPAVLVTEKHPAGSTRGLRSASGEAAAEDVPPNEGAAAAAAAAAAAGLSSEDGPYVMQTRMPLSLFNQQLWLLMKPSPSAAVGKAKAVSMPFNVTLQASGTDGDGVFDVATVIHKTRVLRCTPEDCQDIMLLHLACVNYSRYTVVATFSAPVNHSETFKDVVFYFKTYNPSFTQFEIWFRFTFVVESFIVSVLFIHCLRMYRWQVWSSEQKWLSILLPLLLLYNNPLFPTAFLVRSWVPLFCDGLFQASFLCALLLFFLCLYHELRVTRRRFITFYGPKLVVVGLIWLPAVILATWQAVREQDDPSFQFKLDNGGFAGLKIFFYICGSLYVVYLLFLLVRAYLRLRHVPYFGVRLKFTSGLMVVVMIITVAILILRFGTRIVSDDFIPEITVRYENAAEFVALFGLLNIYMCTLAVVYSPPKNIAHDTRLLESPAELLLNDSEDDIVYTSEKSSCSNKAVAVKTFDSD